FSDTAGARLYRTGDRGRYRATGELEYLGRIDQQIKLRGYRIELGEIEATLLQQADIKSAAVVVHQDHTGNPQIVAYVVKDQSLKKREDRQEQVLSESSLPDLRTYLANYLPNYMIPSAFVDLTEMPLNTNGKIDRRSLALRPIVRVTSERYVAPSSTTEITIAAIWSDLLNIDHFDIHASFFELGGHSLLATQLVSRIRSAFLLELPLRVLFENATVASLALYIDVVRQTNSDHQNDIASSDEEEEGQI
ncbi:MAG: phosphopantetheine-binding protein, partial [Chloroflexota bacterium]